MCSHLSRERRAVGREQNPEGGVSADGESPGGEFAKPH